MGLCVLDVWSGWLLWYEFNCINAWFNSIFGGCKVDVEKTVKIGMSGWLRAKLSSPNHLGVRLISVSHPYFLSNFIIESLNFSETHLSPKSIWHLVESAPVSPFLSAPLIWWCTGAFGRLVMDSWKLSMINQMRCPIPTWHSSCGNLCCTIFFPKWFGASPNSSPRLVVVNLLYLNIFTMYHLIFFWNGQKAYLGDKGTTINEDSTSSRGKVTKFSTTSRKDKGKDKTWSYHMQPLTKLDFIPMTPPTLQQAIVLVPLVQGPPLKSMNILKIEGLITIIKKMVVHKPRGFYIQSWVREFHSAYIALVPQRNRLVASLKEVD